MGKPSRDKGLRGEREVVALLRERGFAAHRVPLSGATAHYKGDVVYGAECTACAGTGNPIQEGDRSVAPLSWCAPCQGSGVAALGRRVAEVKFWKKLPSVRQLMTWLEESEADELWFRENRTDWYRLVREGKAP